MTPYRCIGIMSGTSADGIDAVLLQVDDPYTPHRPALLARASMPFSRRLSHELVHAQELTLKRLTELHYELPQLYADTVQMLPEWQTAACCGVHGQTITHQVQAPPPAPRGTLQIGVSAALATRIHMPVVGDLRAVDVALGGQGAPIVPVAHWFFLAQHHQATLVVNLGGICNVTLVTPNIADVQGYDIGPGMMLSDAYARLISNGRLAYDDNGSLSEGGAMVPALMDELLQHPFIARTPPKSAGREEFGRAYYEPLLARYHGQYPAPDIMRTLIEATAAILHATMVRQFGDTMPFGRMVLTGGGALNPRLRAAMTQAFAPLPVDVETTGVLAPQNHEPAAMALIACRTMHGLPSALPQVTGAPYGHVLGHIFRPTPPSIRLPRVTLTQAPWPERLATLLTGGAQSAALQLLQDGAATAVSLAVSCGGAEPLTWAHGVTKCYEAPDAAPLPAAQQPAVTATSIFDVASLTKVAATTACIAALVSDGRIALHTRVALLLPELAAAEDKQHITVAQLLSHTSGLAPWAPTYLLGEGAQDALAWIACSPVASGSTRVYSDLGYMLLGMVIERVAGQPLHAYFQQRVAHPLKLDFAQFGPLPKTRTNVVATAHGNQHERAMLADTARNSAFVSQLLPDRSSRHPWRDRTQQGEVNDGNAHHTFAGCAGHAGLFATAADVTRVVSALTAQGHCGAGAGRLINPIVAQKFLQPLTGRQFLGWADPSTWQSLSASHEALEQHGAVVAEGFTGCFTLALPSHNLVFTALANRQHRSPVAGGPLHKLYPYWAHMVSAVVEIL